MGYFGAVMKTLYRCLLTTLLTFAAATVVQATEPKIADLQKKSSSAIATFKRLDPEISKWIDGAAGYAIFPKVAKGGFVFGGAGGSGLVYKKDKLIGSVRLSQVTVGAQIGGQSFAELILFETEETLERFKESRLEMSAQATAVAASDGEAKNARYTQGVAIFTFPHTGLMAEASVGGQKFDFTALSREGLPKWAPDQEKAK